MRKLTQYNYLKGELTLFNKHKEELTKKVEEYCQNKEYPLDDRWNLFINSNFGKHKEYYAEFEGIDSDRYFDDFYIEKYETVQVNYLLERGIEVQILDSDDKINAFKENVLKQFIKSFTYYW